MRHPVHKNHSHINTCSSLSLNSNKCTISLVLKPRAMKAFQGASVILAQDEHGYSVSVTIQPLGQDPHSSLLILIHTLHTSYTQHVPKFNRYISVQMLTYHTDHNHSPFHLPDHESSFQ